MARLVFGMNQSLDGYVDHTAFGPGPTLFRVFIEQTRGLAGSLYGRRLYELMRYWDDDRPEWGDAEREFAQVWRAQPKWVVSRTLTSVGPNATLISGELEPAVRRLKAAHEGDIDVGGPALAASLADMGLVDAYRLYLHPVVLGGGTRFFARARPALRLTAHTYVGDGVIRLDYASA
jgi:dihydrofolate reductase